MKKCCVSYIYLIKRAYLQAIIGFNSLVMQEFVLVYFFAQLMPLVLTEAEGRPAVNRSYISSINPADGQCLQEKYGDKSSDCNFGLLGNLYACEGKAGKVSLTFKNKAFSSLLIMNISCYMSTTLLSSN